MKFWMFCVLQRYSMGANFCECKCFDCGVGWGEETRYLYCKTFNLDEMSVTVNVVTLGETVAVVVAAVALGDQQEKEQADGEIESRRRKTAGRDQGTYLLSRLLDLPGLLKKISVWRF